MGADEVAGMVRTVRPKRPVRWGCAAVLAVVLAACAGDMKTDRQIARERVALYLKANPDTPPEIADSMRGFTLRKGMTKRQVIAIWGPPRRALSWRGEVDNQLFFNCGAFPNDLCPAVSRGNLAMVDDEDIFPQAFFTKGRLESWRIP